MRDMNVRVDYRNERMEVVSEKTYSLSDYTAMLKTDLMRIIGDVEDLCYAVNDNRCKGEWSDESWTAFCRIKHKLLDKAGDIGRLPENIVEGSTCQE